MKSSWLRLLPEVEDALHQGAPVVALESTIISHGMPYPQNVETAARVEAMVRKGGAVPATVAIVDGVCRIGLNDATLEQFGKAKGIWKVSVRDLPFVTSKKLWGATTVASTMWLAAQAGIRTFVTGGIGGVHRGAEHSMDVSADLTELGKTNVTVVSAGVKSILDVGLTLEVLETLGVPVVAYGQDEFPSFYSRNSGFLAPHRLDDAASVAALMLDKWKMGLQGGILLANPIPKNQEIPYDVMEAHIASALKLADEETIKGKDITPFLLSKLGEITSGVSLASNIALVLNNAAVGAEIAVAYSQQAKNIV